MLDIRLFNELVVISRFDGGGRRLVTQVKDSYKWVVLGISFFMMMCFALSLQVLPPLFEQMMRDVSFTNSQAGLLMELMLSQGFFYPL